MTLPRAMVGALRVLARQPGRSWMPAQVGDLMEPSVPPSLALALLSELADRGAALHVGPLAWQVTEAGLAALALPAEPPALTFGSATAALALLGQAAGPAHAADLDALQDLLSGVAGALRAPSDAPLVPALLAALGRRP